MKFGICLFALLLAPSVSHAEGVNDPSQPALVYQRVMQAQYAAHSAPEPQRPEEGQRVYELYLRSIGQMMKEISSDAGKGAGTPAQ